MILFSFTFLVENFAADWVLLALWKGHDLVLVANFRFRFRLYFSHAIRNWWIILFLNAMFFRSYFSSVYRDYLLVFLWIFIRLFKFWLIWVKILMKIKTDIVIFLLFRIMWRWYLYYLWKSLWWGLDTS